MSKTKDTIENAWFALNRLCDSNGQAQRWLREQYRIAEQQEREHRAMGRRFTNGSATYRESVRTAARYFCCKWVAEGPRSKRTTWEGACDVRDDARLGYAIRGVLKGKLPADLLTVLAIDYSDHIAGGNK